ncbi:MAG: hypothetical protein JJ934_02925 [Pseudomonadales bacterium]|nr:hypothetical protein [Pseudomonadales bacterium]
MNFRITCLFTLLIGSSAAFSDSEPEIRQYTFAWPYVAQGEMAPRGGATKGPDIKLLQEPSENWVRLQASGIDKKERDRRAILAMSGPYRASFDFLETTVFREPYKPARPYQSWGTEYVYVIVDEEDFISLQHILVMSIVTEDGEIQGPFVVKHWRQDWQYEDRDLYEFRGDDTWIPVRKSRREVGGSWSQSVYQVDDSPRYESYGRWQHTKNYSSWISETTWRPLPRREFSIREDYQALIGTNRHTITPTGWIHEEHNLKAQVSEQEITLVIAQESGFNRYEMITDYEFSEGDRYWSRTSAFWAVVRQAWSEIYERGDAFSIDRSLDESLIGTMFGLAEAEYTGVEQMKRTIDETLKEYLQPAN